MRGGAKGCVRRVRGGVRRVRRGVRGGVSRVRGGVRRARDEEWSGVGVRSNMNCEGEVRDGSR